MSKVTRTIMLALVLGAIAAPVAQADAFRLHDAYGKSDVRRSHDAFRLGDAYRAHAYYRLHTSGWNQLVY